MFLKNPSKILEILICLAGFVWITGGAYPKLGLDRPDLFGWIGFGLILLFRIRKMGWNWDSRFSNYFYPAILGFFVFFLYQWVRIRSFEINVYDFGFMDQVISFWANKQSAFQCEVCRGPNYFSEHFSPILALLSPFVWILGDWTLPIAAIALYGMTYFLWIREIPTAKLRFLATLFFFLMAAVKGPLRFDFREDLFYPPLLLLLLALIDSPNKKKRGISIFVLSVAILAVKENAGLSLFFVAVYAGIVSKERVWGATGAVASIAMFGFVNLFFLPYLKGDIQGSVLEDRIGALSAVLTRTTDLVALKYWLCVMGPSLVLFLVGKKRPMFSTWFLFLSGAAFTFANLAFINPARSLQFHYEAIGLGFFLWAIRNFLVLHKDEVQELQKKFVCAIFLGIATYGPSPISYVRVHWPTPSEDLLYFRLKNLDFQSSFAAPGFLLPYLNHWPEARLLKDSKSLLKSQVVVTTYLPGMNDYASEGWRQTFLGLEGNGWRLGHRDNSVEIWCRESACQNRWFKLQ